MSRSPERSEGERSVWDSSLLLRLGSGQGSEWHFVSDCFVTEFTLSYVEGFLAMTKKTVCLYADTLQLGGCPTIMDGKNLTPQNAPRSTIGNLGGVLLPPRMPIFAFIGQPPCCRVIHSDMLGYWQIKQLYFIRENTQRKIVCYQVCRHWYKVFIVSPFLRYFQVWLFP